MSWTFSDHVRSKGRRYLDEHRVHRDPSPGVYWVRGSELYRIQTDADPVARTATWIVCTCPHGDKVGAGTAHCSHAVAVLLSVLEGRPLPVRARPGKPQRIDPDAIHDYVDPDAVDVTEPPC